MGLFFLFLLLAGFCLVMWDFCHRLHPEQVPKLRRWFINWMLKGLLTPFLLWMAFNADVSVRLPPLMSEVQFAKTNGTFSEAIQAVARLGLFVIGTYWAAVTVAWLLAELSRQAADPRQARDCALLWSFFMGPIAVLITWALGWRFAGLAATIWLLPILQQVLALQPEQTAPPIYSRAMAFVLGLEPDQKPSPIYSRAQAAIHFDKYEEAEQAVIHELESFQDDFDGWMMLAELYATQFHDLPGAQKLVHETCENPATTASQFAVAFHRLADWHLKLAQDPDAARAALEEICHRYPASHLDRMARMRIGQLPATAKEWVARQGVKKIGLPSLRTLPKDAAAAARPSLSRPEAFDRSQQCVERLQTNPDDIAAREELAWLWGEELGQIEMAVEQLELLLAMPAAPPAKSAEWLGLMASWHLKFPQNPPAARAALERLVRQYPKSPQAAAARQRLNLMDLETKMREAAGHP
jgi:tetratricopeptide (TPR) repeat protein